ncbi:MAG: OsmC family protein [Bacteroidales bacterium]|nr:OsmC family protein [Bacteroidales bacterium]
MANFEIIYTTGLRTEMTHLASGTKVLTDAPIDNQGKGELFSPTDLASASLASCMLTIMGIAAREHGFNIDGTKALVTKEMKSEPRRIGRIIVELYFPHNTYSQKQKKILEHISKTCPVALSLHPDLKQEVKLIYLD